MNGYSKPCKCGIGCSGYGDGVLCSGPVYVFNSESEILKHLCRVHMAAERKRHMRQFLAGKGPSVNYKKSSEVGSRWS